MLYRLQKFAIGITHITFLVLLVRTLMGWSAWSLSVGCLSLSALWLCLMALQLRNLLDCFADRMARFQLLIPLGTGLALAVTGALAWTSGWAPLVAAAEIAAWAAMYYAFHKTKQGYYILGHGYMWNDALVNPDISEIGEGDIILTDGNMARRTRNTVGHAELVVKDPKGKLHVVSSWQGKGAVIHTLRSLLITERKANRHYIVLKPVKPWTPEQSAAAWTKSNEMIERNQVWKEAQTQRLIALINRLPISSERKEKLLKKYTPHDGYDWLGLYIGTIKKDRWTCMGFILEVLTHIEVPMESYGTGPLGLTGLANPLMPIRFATRSKQYRLLRKPAVKTAQASAVSS